MVDTFSSLTEIASAIRAGEVSASEMLEAHLARIDEVNPTLNAVVQLCAERAREEASAADAALARGDDLGPLHGVPITLKDSHDTAGVVSDGGDVGPEGLCARLGLDGDGSFARGGGGVDGQDEHAGADAVGRDGQSGVRPDTESA